MSLRRVGQEAGVHVLQVRPAGADRGDAEGVATVSATAAPLVGSVVRVVEGLGVGAWSAAAASGLRQLPTARHKTTAGQSESLTRELSENQSVCGTWRPNSLAPALHDASVLLGSQGVAGRLRQRLDLTGQIVAEEREGKQDVRILSFRFYHLGSF